MSDDLILSEQRGKVQILSLNRPNKLNALSPQMLLALAEALEQSAEDTETRVVVLQGLGRAFAVGADIAAMAEASPVDILHAGTRDSWKRIWEIDLPIIAAVNGFAYGGGCELALSCDLIIAGENALFAQPEINLGIMPGAGGTQRLAKAIGPYKAMELILTGEPKSAQFLLDSGMLNEVVPDEQVLSAAIALADKIAAQPRLAVKLARQALRYGTERTLEDGLEMERRNYLMLYDTEDQKEGMAAFLEKRPPKFSGK